MDNELERKLCQVEERCGRDIVHMEVEIRKWSQVTLF